MEELALPRLKCQRCGHEWVPRKEGKPQTCPKCRSPYWEMARRNVLKG